VEWEFSSEQVVRGDVDYGIVEFRRDLEQEVRMNAGCGDSATLRATFDLVYDLCHWRATGRDFGSFLADFRHDPPTTELLRSINDAMDANVEMLGAILQRLIIDRVEKGMPLAQALEDTARLHADLASTIA
jgi:hypothetical protein